MSRRRWWVCGMLALSLAGGCDAAKQKAQQARRKAARATRHRQLETARQKHLALLDKRERQAMPALASFAQWKKLSPADRGLLRPVLRGELAFALELYEQWGRRHAGQSFLFSPYALASALAMAATGARGETASELRRLLRMFGSQARLDEAQHRLRELLNRPGVAAPPAKGAKTAAPLRWFNRLWIQAGTPPEPAFAKALAAGYGAPLVLVDFAKNPRRARQAILKQFAAATAGRVPALLGPHALSRKSRLLLTSVLLADATPRSEARTGPARTGTFHLPGCRQLTAPLLTWRDGIVSRAQLPAGEVIDLSIPDHPVSLTLFVPARVTGLPELEKRLGPERLREWMALLVPDLVSVRMPQLHLARSLRLDDVLSAMGLTTGFNRQADFTGIRARRRLSLSAVVHHARLDLHPSPPAGSASAQGPAAPSEPGALLVDHPFLFALRHRPTGAVLLLGRVIRPVDTGKVTRLPDCREEDDASAGPSAPGRHRPPRYDPFLRVVGGLTPKHVRPPIQKARRAFHQCYQRAPLAGQRKKPGHVVVAFHIGMSGTPGRAQIMVSTINHKAAEQCVLEVVRKWVFPKNPVEPTLVSFVLGFPSGRLLRMGGRFRYRSRLWRRWRRR